jgi:hypothetical protein
MGEITTVGLDLAKSVFQVHAVDAEGRVAIRRQVRRPNLGGSLQACRPARSAWKPREVIVDCSAPGAAGTRQRSS